MSITKAQLKRTGATFTPAPLADFLAKKLILRLDKAAPHILDPACGDGELLLHIGQQLAGSGSDFRMTGYDASLQYLSIARERLLPPGPERCQLVHGDFLQAIHLPASSRPTDTSPRPGPSLKNSFDLVIANPPYVRTQLLGAAQAQTLAQAFNLKGRVDLYYPFLIAMTESLKEGGILGVITSNRYVTTKSGESIRKYLSTHYEILELIDLGDTKLFDASVLPAIFIGRKARPRQPSAAPFIKVYEESKQGTESGIPVTTAYDILSAPGAGQFIAGAKKYKKTTGTLRYAVAAADPWQMLSAAEYDWVSGIHAAAKIRLGDLFKVRVGIKTTADSVFIAEDWDQRQHKPEEELLKALISRENIRPWGTIDHRKLKVLYPHYTKAGVKHTIDIDRYPRAKKYFRQHEEKLRARKYLTDAGRQWFEIWMPHRPEQWALPKLVFPDISPHPRFCFDRDGRIVNGNCYWMAAENDNETDTLLWVQGIANSRLMTRYHDLMFNNRLYSGRKRYLTQYVGKYPLPDQRSPVARQIIALVKQLNQTGDPAKIPALEQALEIKVAQSFGMDAAPGA